MIDELNMNTEKHQTAKKETINKKKILCIVNNKYKQSKQIHRQKLLPISPVYFHNV